MVNNMAPPIAVQVELNGPRSLLRLAAIFGDSVPRVSPSGGAFELRRAEMEFSRSAFD